MSLAGTRPDPPLEDAEFVVFDLETTGLSAARDRICEVGAVRVRELEVVDSFESLVNPPRSLPGSCRAADRVARARAASRAVGSSIVARFADFSCDALLVSHNARFDQRLPRAAAAVARDSPAGRAAAVHRRHRAPSARGPPAQGQPRLAGALLRGADPPLSPSSPRRPMHCRGADPSRRTGPGDRCPAALGPASAGGAAQARVYGKRSLAHRAPARPGVNLLRDRHEQVLYVGRAHDLPRPSALLLPQRAPAAVRRGCPARPRPHRVAGSRLRVRSRPRGSAPDPRAATTGQLPQPAQRRCRLPESPRRRCRRHEDAEPNSGRSAAGAVPPWLRARSPTTARSSSTGYSVTAHCRGSSSALRSSRAAFATRRRPDCGTSIDALEHVLARLQRLEQLRQTDLSVIAPALERGSRTAFFIRAGTVSGQRTCHLAPMRWSRSTPGS